MNTEKTSNDNVPKIKIPKEDIGIISTSSGLNLRAEPSTTSTVLKVIKFGEIVNLKEEKNSYETIGNVSGKWTKIEKDGAEGWAFASMNFLSKTKKEENQLYVSSFEGLDVYELPQTNSKVLTKLKYGEKITTTTSGFLIKGEGPNWNVIRIGDRLGYLNDQYLTPESYTKEEIEKAPFLGMVYTGGIENCKSGPFSILENSGTPEDRKFYVGRFECRGKNFILLEESIGSLNRYAILKVLSIIDIDAFPKHPVGFFVTSHIGTDMDMSCYTKDKIQIPIAYVNLKKGKYKVDEQKNVTYTDVIQRAWLYDYSSNSLITKDVPGGYCYEPDISGYQG
ncbi:SH3 domain-containing protein [Leptospira yasudae]|uniref:SH3 domain-containing protein n=1 Tax=Leptospira yasudae TaxID=2202201 RepID=UPI00143828CC|nr:SH3 domain-containing protein [Leptospira yasudae]